MADFLRNRVILISNEGFPLCPSAVMRVTSGYVCIAVIVVKDYCAIIGLNQKDLENQGILA
jgi:hypothetical protein